jgi:hypothetical protein
LMNPITARRASVLRPSRESVKAAAAPTATETKTSAAAIA